MRSTPAQSTAPSAAQLHSAGHSSGSDSVTSVAVAASFTRSSSSSSSVLRGAWQRTNTKAKSSTLRACRKECLGKDMSSAELSCCKSTWTVKLKSVSLHLKYTYLTAGGFALFTHRANNNNTLPVLCALSLLWLQSSATGD